MDEHRQYQEAVDRLLTLADFERKSRANQPPDWHLKRVDRLMEMLGEPHLAKPVVHVAGSKGKGSTAALIAGALAANGYRTGLYTSPHLHRFFERIRVDGEPISEREFAHAVNSLWGYAEAIGNSDEMGVVSVFEMLTAMAFVHFRDEADVDVSVIEVGLGGRLDATNVVDPAVSVITPISLDHVPILGNTVREIAAEKAGIIKQCRPTVIGFLEEEARGVIEKVAASKESELFEARDATSVIAVESGGSKSRSQRFTLESQMGELAIETPLLGDHQIDNARTAAAALSVLADEGFELRSDSAASGMSGVRWYCRGEVIKLDDGISLLLDGAHNDASARILRRTIERHFGDHAGVGLVFGGTSGHDAHSVLRELAGSAPAFLVITRSRHPKSLDCRDLAEVASAEGIHIDATVPDVEDALDIAEKLANERGIEAVVACGSLFVAAEAREKALGIEPELYNDLRGPLVRPYLSS